MTELAQIQDDLTDELGCHGAYLSVKQSRSDPRVIVGVHEFVLDDTQNVEERIEEAVAQHVDLPVEIEEM